MKKPNKKQTAIIISVSVAIVVIAVVITLLFALPKNAEIPETTTSSVQFVETFSETMTETETETQTETTTEETTKKRPPAAPVTKPYKPKPMKPVPKPPVTPSKKVTLNVPMVSQLPKYPTGCEGASATMLLRYYGYDVSLDEMIAAIPREDLYMENGKVYGPSIYEKFVGNPTQTYTDERPGYGAFSPVITRSLNDVIAKKGRHHTAKNITGCSFGTLLKHIDEGDPVIVWATAQMKTPQYVNSWYIKGADGKDVYFEYPRGTHVMVLSGYDGQYVYIADPYFGYVKYTYSAFNSKWELLGKQAIFLDDYTAPPTTLPPATIPPITIPPITHPPITLPPTTIPPTTEESTTDESTTDEITTEAETMTDTYL